MSEGVVTPRVPWYQSESQTNTVITSIWSNRVSGQVKQVKKHSNHECLVKQNKHSNQGGDPTQGEVFSNQNTQPFAKGHFKSEHTQGKSEHTCGGPYPRRGYFNLKTEHTIAQGKSNPRTRGGTLPNARSLISNQSTHDSRFFRSGYFFKTATYTGAPTDSLNAWLSRVLE